MATKISELTAAAATDVASNTDVLPLVNAGATKKITVDNLLAAATLGNIGGVSSATPADGNALVWSDSNSNWEPGSAGATSLNELSDVSASNPGLNQVISWDGSSWVPAVPTADVDTPLTAALRGTDSPHIGAYPEQSFKVMDNPSKSAMVITDADGNITYLLKETSAEVRIAKGATGTPVRFALASDLPVFTLENDSGEPDIEVTEPTSGEKISVISGDSDARGANGIPVRQGYNLPDIGANPPPLLISGGTIA